MKIIAAIAGGLLGLAFIAFGADFFFHFIPIKKELPAEGTPAALFMGALYPTGYLAFIKGMEILGGLLVAIPKTRNLGLLVLGPIILNILCFHVFIKNGTTLVDPVNIAISALALFLLIIEGRAFAGLVTRPHSNSKAPHAS